MEIFSFLKISMQINEKSRVLGYKATKIAVFWGPLIRTMRKFVFLLKVSISSYIKSKINVNFFTFWDIFRAIGLKNREKLSMPEEDPKILKSRRTKVVINDMKPLSGGDHI
jgi:hypothetical protein